jgi:L-alanine-DL-glutamate epimerase-like enolase superfamily enzyme
MLMPARFDHGILELRVTSTQVDELRFQMAPPLRLAGRTVPTREYVVLRVTLETGVTGTGYVLTRGQRIGAAAEALAQQIVGFRLADLFGCDEQGGGKSAVQRARAVLDTCAWDLAGTLQEVPTWRLLGDARPHQPCLLVAGYRRHGETDDDMARRLAGWCDAGYRSVKIAADLHIAATAALLAEIRNVVPADELTLVLDLGFAGHDVEQLVEATRAWEPYQVTWVEDPVQVDAASDIAAIRAGAALPIAAGDEAAPGDLFGLLDQSAVDVLRADITTVGGLTGLGEVVARSDVPVSLHVYPEIHRHAAFVMATDSPIETFPPTDDFDFVDRFIHAEDATLVDGRFLPPSAPGLGMIYRPEAVRHNVTRSATFSCG